jgi:regulator of protease activity HflC (stomatin/prohibitin superfamily)
MNTKSLAPAVIVLVLIGAVGWSLFHWSVDRVYVPTGYSLQLRYKGPLLFGSRKTAKPGYWAEEDEIGVRKELRGPGRHFYCPIWWQRELVSDYVIEPGEVGIVTCKLGDPLPDGQFLVDGELGETQFKGVLRKALGPGRYRINPYGYEVKIVKTEKTQDRGLTKVSGWVDVPTGTVGVVTNLADNPLTKQQAGIQDKVLPPGIYPINTREQQVDIVEVGYRESTVAVENQQDREGKLVLDEAGEPMISTTQTGINFPSSDGFPISMDYTAIWGLLPDQAPHAVRTFGNIDQVENKVVLPQIESICRNNGSKYAAVQLLIGQEREIYQTATLEEFKKVLAEKQITLLYGLVRHIYIPKEVRQPIQSAFIADELKLTRQQEQQTAKMEASLREAEQRVSLEKERVVVDTDRQFQTKVAEGERESKRIDAETEKLAAAIEKETAALEAEATTLLGEAQNKGKQMLEEAKADRFRLAVEAFGGPEAYNNWIFATGLPDNIDLKLLYAGEGTLWTDMKNMGLQATMPVNKPAEQVPQPPQTRQRPTPPAQ